MSMLLIPLLFVGIALCAYAQRWWWVALGIAVSFAVRLAAPGPPPDDYSGKGGEAIPRRIIIDTTPKPKLPPIIIKPYKEDE